MLCTSLLTGKGAVPIRSFWLSSDRILPVSCRRLLGCLLFCLMAAVLLLQGEARAGEPPDLSGPRMEIPFGVHAGRAEIALPVPAERALLVFRSSEPGSVAVAGGQLVLDRPLEKAFLLEEPGSSAAVALDYPGSVELHLHALLTASGRLEARASRSFFYSDTRVFVTPVAGDGVTKLLGDARFEGRSVKLHVDGRDVAGIISDGTIAAAAESEGDELRVSGVDFASLGFTCQVEEGEAVPVETPSAAPFLLAFLALAAIVLLLWLICRKRQQSREDVRSVPEPSSLASRPGMAKPGAAGRKPPRQPEECGVKEAGAAKPVASAPARQASFRGCLVLYVTRLPDGQELPPFQLDLKRLAGSSRLTLAEVFARMGAELPFREAEHIAFVPLQRGMRVENNTDYVVSKGPHPMAKGIAKEMYYGESLYIGTRDAAAELLLQYRNVT